MNLALSKDLAVPIDIVTEALAWIGARGSGKTHGAGKLVELLVAHKVPVVVLDPVGVWYGLRLAKDGKGRGLSIPVFGGLHGDVPLEPTAGALIADLIVDKNLSAIIDVSQFESDADKARFAANFAMRPFARKKKDPAVLHMVIDEAQEFIPQNPQPGEQMMLHYFQRILKLGRNFGIGTSILTQRPQETSKKALNQCQTVLAFRLTGPQERKAMREWISAHDLDQSLIEKLPALETGNCHVWSPAFLKVYKEVRILPKETFDASATPKFGQNRAARELAPIDLENLKEAMAATVEKAKAEDPVALRRENAALKRQLADAVTVMGAKKVPVPAAVKIERVEVPVLKKGEIEYLSLIMDRMDKFADRMAKESGDLHATARYIGGHISEAVATQKAAESRSVSGLLPAPHRPSSPPPAAARSPRAVAPVGDLTGPQTKILGALAFLETLGVTQPSKVQVALFVGSSPSSSTYANNLGALRSKGLIDYPNGGAALTEAGRALAPCDGAPTTTAELHAIILGIVTGPQRLIISHVFAAYPNAMTKEDLAANVGVSATSSTFANNLGALRTLGTITYPRGGEVRGADIMFIAETSGAR